MAKVTASKLRENIYQILDSVLRSGRPVEITRKGASLKIIRDDLSSGSKLSRLVRRDITGGKSAALDQISWKDAWKWKD